MTKKSEKVTRVVTSDSPMNEGTMHCRLPPELLQRFDELAAKAGVNRSQLLRAIMQKALGEPDTELALMQAVSLSAGAARRIAALAIGQLPDWIRTHARGELERLEAEQEQRDPTVAVAMDAALARWRKQNRRNASA